jgi:hypothetical protein
MKRKKHKLLPTNLWLPSSPDSRFAAHFPGEGEVFVCCLRRHTEKVNPMASVPQNHRLLLRSFCPQPPISFVLSKSLTSKPTSPKENPSSLLITPILAETFTVSSGT